MENRVIRQDLREITAGEVIHIQEVVKRFPRLTRHELAQTLCEHLSWYSPSGALKVKSSLMLLDRLADQGLVVLPDKTTSGRLSPDKPPALTKHTAQRPLIALPLKTLPPIELQLVNDKEQIQLWNEYMERYHPLKYKRPFGNWLRYFLLSDNEPLGCLLISGAAKALQHRDQIIDFKNTCTRFNNDPIIKLILRV